MDEAVAHKDNKPVYYKRDLLFTRLVVDPLQYDVFGKRYHYTVYYAGTSEWFQLYFPWQETSGVAREFGTSFCDFVLWHPFSFWSRPNPPRTRSWLRHCGGPSRAHAKSSSMSFLSRTYPRTHICRFVLQIWGTSTKWSSGTTRVARLTPRYSIFLKLPWDCQLEWWRSPER